MRDFTNRVALVTDSSLGAKVTLNYASDDANAALTLAEVRDHGVDAVAIQADVSKMDDVEHLFTQTLDRFGTLDIVVANAGIEIIDQPILAVAGSNSSSGSQHLAVLAAKEGGDALADVRTSSNPSASRYIPS